MWYNTKAAAAVNTHLPAFSLIESLISLTLGSLLLLSAVTLFQPMYRDSQQQQTKIRLQQNTHQLLDYLKQTLSHAGYRGVSTQSSNFPLFQGNNPPYLVEPHCVIALVDLNADGCLGKGIQRDKLCQSQQQNRATDLNKEIIAFRLEQQQLMVLSKYERFTLCTAQTCPRLLQGCSQLKWDKIANLPDSLVRDFHLSWIVPDRLLSIQLTLSAPQDPSLYYTAQAQIYLLNGAAP